MIGEIVGAGAYASAHAGERHVAAAESDFGAGRVWKFGHRVADGATPLMATVARVLAPLGIGHDAGNDARGGSDLEPLAAQGVPTLSLAQDGTGYFDVHHTPDDTLDKIDRRQLDQNVAAYAATTWLVADSDVATGPVAPPPHP